MTRFASILAGAILSCPALADPVSFRREVVPALTKAGCNSGSCHGTPSGKNGFRLSLRGYDPAADLASLTRELGGRRIDQLAPANSLFLLKGTGRVEHGGGVRLIPGGEIEQLLQRWIVAGATDDQATRPARLDVLPAQAVVDAPASGQQFHVSATFPDGRTADVTPLARFSVADDEVATISPDGQVEKKALGQVTVVAEYMNIMATAVVIFRDPAVPFRWPDPPEVNAIDRAVFAQLRELRIEPAGLCSDAEFIRRASLDAVGRLPTPERVRQFLADTSLDKRARLIDELLARDEFADWWGLKWADRLGVNQRFVGKIGAIKYHEWVREQIRANVPEDELTRRILTAAGGNYSHPAAGFFRRLRDPAARAEEVSQLFLGVRIACAKCHNHPGDRWTQDDYYQLAAFFDHLGYRDGPFFNQIYDKEETVIPLRAGTTVQPRTGRVMAPKFLGGDVPALAPGQDPRAAFADWLTAPANPFFAKAAANRIWFHLFGRGIVEPVDDFRCTNPPSNPALLELLAREFTAARFDRKQLIRLVMNSRTYQAAAGAEGRGVKYATVYPIRRLAAEQLLDAVSDATGVAEKFPGQPAGISAAMLPDGEYKHPFLEAFGRPARAMSCECERASDTSLGQALVLVGGRFTEEKLRDPAGRLAKCLRDGRSDAAVIEELFLATLSRVPTPAESSRLQSRLTAAGPSRRAAVFEDIFHALLNHPEFVFQH